MDSQISVFSANRSFRRFEKEIYNIAAEALKILKKRNVAIDIFLVSGKEMKRLNRELRDKDKTADVLSIREPRNFPHPELQRGPTRTYHLGEIYLNHNAMRKMRIHANNIILQHSHQFVVWHRYLLVHGLLHLLGYDHKKKSDRMKMERQEQRLLRLIKERAKVPNSHL